MQVTYGSYTGQTKKDKKSALQQYRALNNQRDPKQNELICRDDMIAAPPHILITNYAMLEYCIREDLKLKVPRVMGVLDPIKLVITNYPDKAQEFMSVNNLTKI